MIVYAFYWLEEIDKVHFIGLLPERRKNPERISQESILNLAGRIFGNEGDIDDLFFIEMTLDENGGQILWPEQFIRLTQAEA